MIKKYNIYDNTTLFRFGKPFNTGAVINDINQIHLKNVDSIQYFNIVSEKDKTILSLSIEDESKIFGLGQTLGGLDKKGKKYRFYSNDDPLHTPEKEGLYGNHPFCIVDGKESFGIFIDCPTETIFDVGFSDKKLLSIEIMSLDFDIYFFNIDNKLDIIKSFLNLTGLPYFPPKWAFGYQQCRWSYPDQIKIEEIANIFRKYKIPCDAIYMDIDYMEDFKVFTVDKKKFSDMKNFQKILLNKGFHLVPIIDPGVKVEDNYYVYEEGKKGGYFCKDGKRKDFIATVWPGKTCFPDFLNSKVREWWGNLYKNFVDSGINSFWNDMNEPAIFFTPRGLKDFFDLTEKVKNQKDIGFDFFSVKDKMNSLSNNGEDYKSFFHKLDDNTIISHDKVHNLYGYNMALATSEGLKKNSGNKRYFLLSRSSYIGMHRFSAIWMGDNQSWWEHILVHIRMLQSLNMCGFFYTGPDIGGFGGNCNSELLIRWTQLGVFTPFFRNHSALGTRDQEPWAFDEETTEMLKRIIQFRYSLIPYIYSEFMSSLINLRPIILPVSFVFNNPDLKSIEDQFMFGNSIMVAPIYQPNMRGRFVLLPDNKWLCCKVKEYDKINISVYQSGGYFISCKLDEQIFFIKENSIIVLSDPQNYVGEKIITDLKIIAFVTDKASFIYYDDDGESYNYKDGGFVNIGITIEQKEGEFIINYEIHESEIFKNNIKKIFFDIYDENCNLNCKIIELK